MKSYNH